MIINYATTEHPRHAHYERRSRSVLLAYSILFLRMRLNQYNRRTTSVKSVNSRSTTIKNTNLIQSASACRTMNKYPRETEIVTSYSSQESDRGRLGPQRGRLPAVTAAGGGSLWVAGSFINPIVPLPDATRQGNYKTISIYAWKPTSSTRVSLTNDSLQIPYIAKAAVNTAAVRETKTYREVSDSLPIEQQHAEAAVKKAATIGRDREKARNTRPDQQQAANNQAICNIPSWPQNHSRVKRQ